jgi:hypothetical protein
MVFNGLIAVSTQALSLFVHLPHHVFPKLFVEKESGTVGIPTWHAAKT